MQWIEIEKIRPPHGELIWVWDMDNHYKFLIRYMGSEETWMDTKKNTRFPIWAPLNDPNNASK